MKKNRLFALGIALCLTLSLAACGKAKITGIQTRPDAELAKGQTIQLEIEYSAENGTAQDAVAQATSKIIMEWKSSDETVATVDKNGLVTAVGEGECDITVAMRGKSFTSQCKLTVTEDAAELQPTAN